MTIPNELITLHTENHYQLPVPQDSSLAETLGYKSDKARPPTSQTTNEKKIESKDETYECEDSENTDETDESSENESVDISAEPRYIHIGVPDDHFRVLYEKKNEENKILK